MGPWDSYEQNMGGCPLDTNFKELRISSVVPQLFWFPEMELSPVPNRFLEVDGLHPSVELKREAFGLLSGLFPSFGPLRHPMG